MFLRQTHQLTLLALILCSFSTGFVSRAKRADNAQFPQGAGPKKPGRLDQNEEAGGGGDAGAMSEDEVVQDYQPTGQNTTEQGMPPKYPLNVVSAEASAHDNEVAGCRDHTNASMVCAKARNPCFCEEHETYMYSYCRRSCKYCDPETRTYHRYWRVRAASDFNPTWMVSEIEMYTQRGENTSLTLNATSGYASSEYDGFSPRSAFDRNMFTTWMPSGWEDHPNSNEWIAYEFPIPVNVKSVRLAGNPQYPRSTPSKMIVEASDFRDGPFLPKWKIRNPDYVTDRIYNFIECPVLWRRFDADFDTYCFRLMAKFKSWPEASRSCEEEGGELASILNDDELRFILQDLRICGFVWIGLNDRSREGFYEWADAKNSTYTRWPKGLYYDEVQRHYQDCVAMDADGNWYFFHCTNKHYYICRKTLVEPKPPLPEIPPASEEPPIIFLAPNYTLPVAAHISPHPAAKEESSREHYAELLTEVAVQQMKEKGFKPPMSLANMIKPPADMSQKLVQITAQAEAKLKQLNDQFVQKQEQDKQALKEHYEKQEQTHKQVHGGHDAPQVGGQQGSGQENQDQGQQQQPQPTQAQQQPPSQQQAQAQAQTQQQQRPQQPQQQQPVGEQPQPPKPSIADKQQAATAAGQQTPAPSAEAAAGTPPKPPNPVGGNDANEMGQGGENQQETEEPSQQNQEESSGQMSQGTGEKIIRVTKVSKRPPVAPHVPHGPKGSPHASPNYPGSSSLPPSLAPSQAPGNNNNEKVIEIEKIGMKPPPDSANAPNTPPPRPENMTLPIPPPPPPNEGDEPKVTAPSVGESGDEASGYPNNKNKEEEEEKEAEERYESVMKAGNNQGLKDSDEEGKLNQNIKPPQPEDAPDTPDELRNPNENDEADSALRKLYAKAHRRHKTIKLKELSHKRGSKRHKTKHDKTSNKEKEQTQPSTSSKKRSHHKKTEENLFKNEDEVEGGSEAEDQDTASGSASDEVESRRIEPELEGLIRQLI